MASCGGGAFACWLGWVEDGLVTAEDPAMLADDAAVLAAFNAVGPVREPCGPDFDRATDGARPYRVFVGVEAN
jgi:hypothetical protein